jgi:hypothetical protein
LTILKDSFVCWHDFFWLFFFFPNTLHFTVVYFYQIKPLYGYSWNVFLLSFSCYDIRLAWVSSHGLMGSQRVKFSSLWNLRQVPFKWGLIIFRVNLPFLGTHSNELRNMNLIAEMSGAIINISHVADFSRWIHLFFYTFISTGMDARQH